MSALPWRPHTSHVVGQDRNSLTNSDKETIKISHQVNGRKTSKANYIELHTECDQKRRKRKSDDIQEHDCVRPSDVFDSLLEQTDDLQTKRPRSNPQTWTAGVKSAVLLGDSWEVDSGFSSEISPSTSGRSSPIVGIDRLNVVAMDCEMVGTGPGGRCSELARCSIVNYYGSVIYDKYILPGQRVTDFRTRWSGIRKHHLANAVPFEEAQNEIVGILKGKVIIGHSLFNDFKVLDITVPANMIRDTCSCRLLRELYEASHRCMVSLKKLSQRLLSRNIQVGRKGHCSIEDARATLDLYKLVEDQWEKDFSRNSTDHTSDPNYSLEDYMQDQYWPESVMDCSS
ncbi:apoptosis-enhancing nuclease [Triplophysa dalaica]|uniref:apoptosis-enhancing nuclease n=1 Tax=Triplophysa dalaica TaxID=1582913 RepID=UPI0024DF6650|nr:apoptosis-enhancing nuclease [Triplophysa dalaica]XP_056596052.1 apoptosis-enhancing nuclease [Triplophysa dalaica]XP_056596053.1 apoptosis-enhancing nuclease [Triplophysa dalaica]